MAGSRDWDIEHNDKLLLQQVDTGNCGACPAMEQHAFCHHPTGNLFAFCIYLKSRGNLLSACTASSLDCVPSLWGAGITSSLMGEHQEDSK